MLESEAPTSLVFEAVAEFGDQRHLPRLRTIYQKAKDEDGINQGWLDTLNDAIEKLEEKGHMPGTP